jgi:hypothetical protein
MLPKKELMALASALKATPEYNEMMKQRRLIMQNQRLSRVMMNFEREHARIMHHDFPEDQVAAHMKSLFDDNKVFLETNEIKVYMKSAKEYQYVVSQCVDYLNGLFDAGHSQRPY